MLDLFLIYCSISAGMCVDVRATLDPPLTQFSQCEVAGRDGDAIFQASHPGWRLRAWTCTLRKARELPA
jgi:hypothetical protein